MAIGSTGCGVILLAALVFGLGHLYQGAAGIVKISAMGVLFGVLCWMTGSVWAPMLLHVVVDLNSGWLNWQIVRKDAFDDPAEPAAVYLFEQKLGGSQEDGRSRTGRTVPASSRSLSPCCEATCVASGVDCPVDTDP